jgi:hypothetical protein
MQVKEQTTMDTITRVNERHIGDDIGSLRDEELDTVTGGAGLATMLTQAVGQAVTQAANQLVKEAGLP